VSHQHPLYCIIRVSDSKHPSLQKPPNSIKRALNLSKRALHSVHRVLDAIKPALCTLRRKSRVHFSAGKVAGLIWIRFVAEALRFSFAKSSRPPLKMWKCKVKITIISRFKLFQVFTTQKSGIHGPLSEVVHGNWGALTSTKSLNVC